MRGWLVASFVALGAMAVGLSCEDSSVATTAAGGQGAAVPDGGDGGTGGVDPCPSVAEIDDTPPDDPGPPAAAPPIDCGTPTFVADGSLRRRPYLQSVTTTTARIAWTATGATTGLVRVASSQAGPWTEVPAISEAFPTDRTGDTEDYLAFDARLDGLEPGQAYCYEVVVDGETVASGLGMHTAWTGGDRPVRVLAMGDSGALTPEQTTLRDVMLTHDADVFLHLGDMAYGEGTFVQFEERVFDIYAELLHRVPTYPTIGNHEYKTDNAQPYLDVYYLFEQALRPDDQERYYSFDYGDVHFVSLDSNDQMLLPIAIDGQNLVDDDMIDWLRDDLAGSDAPWKIAFFHHPPFSLYADRGDNTSVIKQILPALRDGDVDLILVGHDHHYMRSFPVRGDCEVPGGDGAIPFIIVGSGGTGLHPFEDDEDWYVAYGNDQVHAFLALEIQGCRGLGESISIDGDVIDSFVINGCLN